MNAMAIWLNQAPGLAVKPELAWTVHEDWGPLFSSVTQAEPLGKIFVT